MHDTSTDTNDTNTCLPLAKRCLILIGMICIGDHYNVNEWQGYSKSVSENPRGNREQLPYSVVVFHRQEGFRLQDTEQSIILSLSMKPRPLPLPQTEPSHLPRIENLHLQGLYGW